MMAGVYLAGSFQTGLMTVAGPKESAGGWDVLETWVR
jgi:hypothetical protein